MLLKDVVNKSLSDWKLQYGYIMELSHNLMGCFPALITETKKIVVCLDRDDLEKIWLIMPRRKIKIKKILFCVNREEKIVISINSPKGEESDSESFNLILSDELKDYLEKPGPFEWASGLVSFRSEAGATFPRE